MKIKGGVKKSSKSKMGKNKGKLIETFIQLSQTNKELAEAVLKDYEWNVQSAVNGWFNNPAPYLHLIKEDTSKIEQIFEKYKTDETQVTISGTEQLFEDAGCSLEGDEFICFAWCCDAQNYPISGTFLKEEFFKGFSTLGAQSVVSLKERIKSKLATLSDDKTFKKFYNYVFHFGREVTKKGLEYDVAIELWPMVVKKRFGLLDAWLQYLEDSSEYKGVMVVEDLWTQLFDFIIETPDIETFDFDESTWPLAIDGFIEYCQEKKILNKK